MGKRFRQVVVSVLVVLMVVVAVVIGIGSVKKAKMLRAVVKTVHMYGEAISDRNYRRAYRLSAPELRESMSYEQFVSEHEKIVTAMGTPKSISVYWIGLDDSGYPRQIWARVKAEMTCGKGVVPMLIVLHFANGEWGILRFEAADVPAGWSPGQRW